MEIEESLYVLVSSSACPNYRTDVQFTSGHFYSDSNNNSFAFFFFLKSINIIIVLKYLKIL